MLVTLQFPIVDLRKFVQDDLGLLKKPAWPEPGTDNSFIRSFGRVERRPKGGLTGWIGEAYSCNANNAFQFKSLPSFIDDHGNRIKMRIAFRRLYSDGLALCKLEVGLVVWGFRDRKYWIAGSKTLSPQSSIGLLDHILSLQVVIQSVKGIVVTPLKNAGDKLAEHYVQCTTKQPKNMGDTLCRYVKACNPCLAISYQLHKESLQFPFDGKSVNIDSHYLGCLLSGYTIPNTYPRIPLWTIGELESDDQIRKLRIFILRLHAEKECLRSVLAAVKEDSIVVTPRSTQSRLLQLYLKEASKHIQKLNNSCNKCLEGEIEYLSFSALDIIAPGEREEILRSLRIVDAEKNVFGLVQELLERSYKNLVIVENYRHQQVNQGNLTNIEDSTNVKVEIYSNDNLTSFLQSNDMQQLAEELGKLQLAILAEKPSSDANKDIANIAKAGVAAIENDPKKVSDLLSGLAKSGQWILGIAEKIGVPLALDALKLAFL